jgi:hypothetical protein
MYRMEPVKTPTVPFAAWMVELEIGGGIGRNFAVVTDLRRTKRIPTLDGNVAVKGAKTRTFPLPPDEIPTSPDTALEVADGIALALLQIPGKARPSDLVLYAFYDGLCAATANKPPAWQHFFKYTHDPEEEPTKVIAMVTNLGEWWKAMGISNLDDLENPRKK